MKFKIFLYHAHEWIFTFPATMFHELCHWIVAFLFYCVDLIVGMPKIKITEWHKISWDENRVYTQTMSAQVSYETQLSSKLTDIVVGIGAIAPAVGIILLMYFCPWYVNIIIFSKITTFWPSISDLEQFNKIFKKTSSVALNISNKENEILL